MYILHRGKAYVYEAMSDFLMEKARYDLAVFANFPRFSGTGGPGSDLWANAMCAR
jgi:hypothetical protein